MINRKLVVFVSFCILSISSFAQTRLDSIRNKLFAPENKNVLVASHRGDWRNACENSIEAIDNAVKMGVDIVEVDLARTKDGHLILMHDSKLDRTTTGKGLVADHTLAEIKALQLRNGCHIKTIYKVPTLEEALLFAKGRVMLNLDKAFDYFDQVYTLLEKTGTTDMVIMKSDAPADYVKKNYVKNAMKGRARIWYNTLWNTHAGGHDDDCSLVDPDEGYGYLIDSLGASILQTDRPAYLINYLKKKELKKKWECIENWDYLSVENEWTMQTSPNFDVEEVFLKGKHTPATNEDGIIVTPYFAAVIDGATAKSELEIDGKKTGRIAMELVIEAIHDFPKDIDANEALKRITEKIHSFYVQHRLLEELEKTPGSRFTANGVIYSY